MDDARLLWPAARADRTAVRHLPLRLCDHAARDAAPPAPAAPRRRLPGARRRTGAARRRARADDRRDGAPHEKRLRARSEEHTSELQSIMRISYAVLLLKKNKYK